MKTAKKPKPVSARVVAVKSSAAAVGPATSVVQVAVAGKLDKSLIASSDPRCESSVPTFAPDVKDYALPSSPDNMAASLDKDSASGNMAATPPQQEAGRRTEYPTNAHDSSVTPVTSPDKQEASTHESAPTLSSDKEGAPPDQQSAVVATHQQDTPSGKAATGAESPSKPVDDSRQPVPAHEGRELHNSAAGETTTVPSIADMQPGKPGDSATTLGTTPDDRPRNSTEQQSATNDDMTIPSADESSKPSAAPSAAVSTEAAPCASEIGPTATAIAATVSSDGALLVTTLPSSVNVQSTALAEVPPSTKTGVVEEAADSSITDKALETLAADANIASKVKADGQNPSDSVILDSPLQTKTEAVAAVSILIAKETPMRSRERKPASEAVANAQGKGEEKEGEWEEVFVNKNDIPLAWRTCRLGSYPYQAIKCGVEEDGAALFAARIRHGRTVLAATLRLGSRTAVGIVDGDEEMHAMNYDVLSMGKGARISPSEDEGTQDDDKGSGERPDGCTEGFQWIRAGAGERVDRAVVLFAAEDSEDNLLYARDIAEGDGGVDGAWEPMSDDSLVTGGVTLPVRQQGRYCVQGSRLTWAETVI